MIALILGLFLSAQAQDLPRLNIVPNSTTVSGVSSGAYMAVQMQVAFSDLIAGSASIAGGTFWCAQGNKLKAQLDCMGQPNLIQSSAQIAEAKRLATEGAIDDLAHLQTRRIYIFASPQDYIIRSGNSDKLIEFLSAFLPRANIFYDQPANVSHGFPTLAYGAPCARGQSPWLLNCQRDTAGDLLKSLYGALAAAGQEEPTHLRKFSQGPYKTGDAPLYDEGWIYVPAACQAGQACKLHIALHGCQMNPEDIQDQFVTHAGYNAWAETNGIVVLYPQSGKIAGDNPYGCWDWFGFTGKNYVTKDGAQMKALRSMIRAVSGL